MNESTTDNTEVARPAREVAKLLHEAPQARVFDVRTAESRAAGARIPESELLDVNEELAAGNLAVLLDAELPRNVPLVFVCNTGGKCTKAASFLAEHGYDARSVEGGMRAWVDEELPTED